MLCKFDRLIYPRGITSSINGYMVAVYKPCGILRDAAGNRLDSFKAVGYCLPVSGKLKYRMEGRWTKSSQHGIQFEVARYEEVIVPSKQAELSRSIGTLNNYKIVFRRASATLGAYRMVDITPVIMRSYITDLQANGVSERNGTPLSYNTIGKHYNVLHTFFETAVDDEVIGCSPMQRMKKPKPKKDAVQTDEKSLTLEESRRLLACLKDEPLMWRALIMFFLDSGCRRGEAVAMRWEDIDLKTGRIEVKGNAQYTVEKGKYITTPKSGKGRTVFLNEPVLAVLKEWKRKQAKWLLSMGLPHTGFVFTQDDGEMLNPNAPTKYLSKFGKRYGFPGLHPHTLRHTMATISIANNADIVSISKKLGHAAPSITLNVYSHANQEAQLRANKTLEIALYEKA